MHAQDRDLVLRYERPRARQELVGDDSGGVEVGARVDVLAERLLGRHVVGGPERDAGLGQRVAGAAGLGLGVAHQLGDAEVEELDDVALLVRGAGVDEHDVVGLEIAVDDALAVRVRQRLQHLPHDDERARRPDALLGDLAERAPRDELHGEEERAVVERAEVDDADDVRVREEARRVRLALEALRDLGDAPETGEQRLHREVLAGGEVRRLVDRAHPASADAADEPVASGDHRADARVGGFGHLRSAARSLMTERPAPRSRSSRPDGPGTRCTCRAAA